MPATESSDRPLRLSPPAVTWARVRVISRILLVGFALVAFGCSPLSRTAASLPIDSPFLRQLGFTARGTLIINSTPLYGVVHVYGAQVALLRPGDSVAAIRYWDPRRLQLPVVLSYYADVDRSSFLGIAARVLPPAPEGDVTTWRVTLDDIRAPDGRRPAAPESHPALSSTPQRVEFPREALGGTAAIQIANNTEYAMAVYLNGSLQRRTMQPGDVYYSAQTFIPNQPPIIVGVGFIDGNRSVGIYTYVVYHPGWEIVPHQLVIDTRTIRRP